MSDETETDGPLDTATHVLVFVSYGEFRRVLAGRDETPEAAHMRITQVCVHDPEELRYVPRDLWARWEAAEKAKYEIEQAIRAQPQPSWSATVYSPDGRYFSAAQ
jgi:hypothetical protein